MVLAGGGAVPEINENRRTVPASGSCRESVPRVAQPRPLRCPTGEGRIIPLPFPLAQVHLMSAKPARKAVLRAEPLEDRVTPVSFTTPTGYATPSNGMSVAAGDFNGDGKPDAVVSNSAGVTTFLDDGTGVMTTATTMGAGSGFPRTVRVADMNGDGKLDVVTAND